mgnify:FL=1
MPKRPRTHVLERLSQAALTAALPPHWIVRWESIDYGIDGTVELVEEDGTVTGEVFAVQLKSTDKEEASRARVSSSTLSYYSIYSLPVLLVLYNAADDRLYVRWVDDVLGDADPETIRRWRNQDTVAVEFADTDDLGIVGAETLAQATRESLSGRPRRPLVAVAIGEFGADPDQPPVRSPDGIRNQIHDETLDLVSRLLPGRIHVVDDEEAADVFVRLTAATETATLSVYLRAPEILSPDEVSWSGPIQEIPYWVSDPGSPSKAVSHVLLAIGFALGQEADIAGAARLLLMAAPSCTEFL